MKPITSSLTTLLATRKYMYASLFQFALVNGNNLYYTDHRNNISWGGNIYSSGGTVGPYFNLEGNKCKMTQVIGTGAQQFQLSCLPAQGTINGQAILSAIRQGVFDGAELTYSGAYWAQGVTDTPLTPVAPTGVIIKQVGRIANVDIGRTAIIFTANDHLELLNLQMPRNLYQAPCANSLYDAGCTLNQASFAVSGTVISGSTVSVVKAALSQATGYFDLGQITFTSGINNGVTRSIKTYIQGTPGTVSLFTPLPSAPSAGNTFTIYPGCQKDINTCTTKFNNALHFRGEPYIPAPETAV